MICRHLTASVMGRLALWVVLPASSAVAAPVDTSELARCHAIAVRDARLDCYEALAVSALSAAATGPAAPPAHSIDPNEPANFGLTRHQLEAHPGGGGPSSIKSVVSQITEDRVHNITVVLDNGQTWTFIESDARLRPGDAVTIKRASLGSFLMLTPSRRSYRVERLK